MYHLVLYSLSPIQKGIQCYHAGMEYAYQQGIDNPEFQQWIKNDKTVIILDGGSSNQSGKDYYSKEPYTGTLDIHLQTLRSIGIPVAAFYEPDLNNTMTALAFLVDEKVWDKKLYPPITINRPYLLPEAEIKKNEEALEEEEYGSKAAFLRQFLQQFRLAS